MWGYVSANQFSPRINFDLEVLARARPSTAAMPAISRPPELSLSAPINIAAYNGTSAAGGASRSTSPVQPERSNVFDLGVDQQLSPWLTSGLDAYYKLATDLLDDGQFGQANTLTAFNYAKGWNVGVEGKSSYYARQSEPLSQCRLGPPVCDRRRLKPILVQRSAGIRLC